MSKPSIDAEEIYAEINNCLAELEKTFNIKAANLLGALELMKVSTKVSVVQHINKELT